MKLFVYKGFENSFYSNLTIKPLLNVQIEKKRGIFQYDKRFRKQLSVALLSLEDDDEAWITYEEYSLIKTAIEDAIREDNLKLEIYKNNLYPDCYPLPVDISEALFNEIKACTEEKAFENVSEECKSFLTIYTAIFNIDGVIFASYYNYEFEHSSKVSIRDYYPANLEINDSGSSSEFEVFLNEDLESYLRNLLLIIEKKPSSVGLKSTGGNVSMAIQRSLVAFCQKNSIKLFYSHEKMDSEILRERELVAIAEHDLGIESFKFREIPFYKNPDFDNSIIKISQEKIMNDIIEQAENAFDEQKVYRDIFITASTGAGKSVMFQVPAIYLAQKYGKLTIVIEPVKALMQDQMDKLIDSGYDRVAVFNSDLITQVEKEMVLERIKAGKVDILYLSPETLLSYSIDTIIGDREIGLLIVDEAHIVTTWGIGFRPDYWYLGGYINKIRNKTSRYTNQRIQRFPICAFTATAINGGEDDSVSDTIISLYMENPIKYLGYVRRDNISFDVMKRNLTKLRKEEYLASKVLCMNARIDNWLRKKEKTIVYFPYATHASDAKKGIRDFSNIRCDEHIDLYISKNVDEVGREYLYEMKRDAFDNFRSGKVNIMYATKAFGMGVDIDDIQNVYHFAANGNLCDYVQEIGRAARKENSVGYAITDYFYNDLTYTNTLFGMSQIRAYQIKKVLQGIYNVYVNKNYSRNFLISPGSFSYIFGKTNSEDQSINRLKTCLLMLEKDLYDKYQFKVLISRPQSVFTKSFIVIDKEKEEIVLNSKYGEHIRYVCKGRDHEMLANGGTVSDTGDIFIIDLKAIWEKYYPNMSFPSFKYHYFNNRSLPPKKRVDIMPEIFEHIGSRQKLEIETKGDLLISDLRERILEDFDYICDRLYTNQSRKYFVIEEFEKLILERYGRIQAKVIGGSLFELVDPNGRCVKSRNNDGTGKREYYISNGNLKEMMRATITKCNFMANTQTVNDTKYSTYMSSQKNTRMEIALKILSVFDYITYETIGGEQPEIFIRLNDPNKIKGIVQGTIPYTNSYVTRARQKHDRDVRVLRTFFEKLDTTEERWTYIEKYFLGYDVLCDIPRDKMEVVSLSKSINREKSYPTSDIESWGKIADFLMESSFISLLSEKGIPIPEYIETVIKKSDIGENILMSWPSKNALICDPDTPEGIMSVFQEKGWVAYRSNEIDVDALKEVLV